MKLFIIFAGPNGSGKSSIISSLSKNISPSPFEKRGISLNSITYVNADFVTRNDPIISQMPNGIEKDIAAWNATNTWRDHTLECGSDCIWETVFSDPRRLDEIKKAHDLGYYIILVYVTTLSPDINVERVNLRVQNNGHGVPEDKIRSRYERTTTLIPKILSEVDEGYIYDNSSANPIPTILNINKTFYMCNTTNSTLNGWVEKNISKPLEKAGYKITTVEQAKLSALFMDLKTLK